MRNSRGEYYKRNRDFSIIWWKCKSTLIRVLVIILVSFYVICNLDREIQFYVEMLCLLVSVWLILSVVKNNLSHLMFLLLFSLILNVIPLTIFLDSYLGFIFVLFLALGSSFIIITIISPIFHRSKIVFLYFEWQWIQIHVHSYKSYFYTIHSWRTLVRRICNDGNCMW